MPGILVSILVLMEVGLRVEYTFLLHLCWCVSILVLMEVGLRENSFQTLHSWKEVSILVLMEVGLRVIYYFLTVQGACRCNPCFNGSWSERKK